MSIDINKHETDIDNLKKQNELDLCSIKELYRKLAETEEKLTQIKYIDNTIIKKLKKEYESLKKENLDENIQSQLNEINSQMDNITERIDGLELSGNLVLRDVIDGEIFTLDNNTTPSITYGNIVISKTSSTIIEGNTDSFTVKLDKAPSNNQVVTLSKNNSDVTLDKNSLTFTPSNYIEVQTVNISVAEDSDYSNESCTITLSSPNVTSKTILVSITDNDEKPSNIPVQSVSLPTTHTLKVDETLQLTPVITPPDATNQSVNWSTNNGNCTVVDGLVTAIAEGECIITCTTVDQNKTAECTITVESETETVNFTNLLVNSDTFVIPSGYSTYWMKYKLNNVVNPSGTIALTPNTEGANGSFKLNFGNYYQSNGVNPLDSTHAIYFKYKKSTDGSIYSLVSNYYESGNASHPATKSITIMNETIPYGSTYYFKDFIMIDLTEIYGSGNEPTKTECDTIFSNLWHT